MGGAAPVVDASGNIWVTAGNGSVTSSSHAYDDSDSVLELSPSLALEQYFAPSSWPSDNARRPRPVDRRGAARRRPGRWPARSRASSSCSNGASLGGVGGQQAAARERLRRRHRRRRSPSMGSTVYLPCLSGPIAVQASDSPPGSVCSGALRSAAGLRSWPAGSCGPSARTASSTASIRRPARSTAQATIGAPANHFPTPSVGAGLLLAPSANRVVAFSASTAASPTTTTTARPTPRPHDGQRRSTPTGSNRLDRDPGSSLPPSRAARRPRGVAWLSAARRRA